MKNFKKTLLLLTLLAAECHNARMARAAYDDVGVGARVTGLGGAFTAIADDVYSVYYNPAGLGTIDRPMLGTTYSRLHMGLSDDSALQNSFVAYARPIKHGRQGAWGAAWNYFTLDSLYSETSLYASYGRRLFAQQLPNGFYAGASMKLLRRSVGNTDVADNAVNNTGARIGSPDPVLVDASKTNIDLDLGLLYRIRPRLSAGLMVQHLMEPNIAFAAGDDDKLGRNVKLGLAWQTAWTSIAGELDFLKAPDGKTDKVGTLAFEKWLPTLVHGTFGVRTSVGLGDRDFRQLTAGLSYRVHRLQLDYGFTLPIGGIADTFGTHRMGLSFRFGRPRGAEPQLAEAILENMRELADVGSPEFRAQSEELALYKRTAQQEFLRQARADTGEGRFAEAREKLNQALSLNPKDLRIQASLERVALTAEVFPEITGFRTDAAQAALYEGVMDFLAGRDKEAVRKLSYAASLQPGDERFERFLQTAERKAGITRELPDTVATAPTLGREKAVGAGMALMEVALRESDYPKVLKLADEVLELDPQSVLAFKRKATALYAVKKYEDALRALRSALKFERDGDERKRLKAYVDALVALIERGAREKEEPRPETMPLKPTDTGKGSPVEIQRLYEAGVDLYAQGRLSEAANMFQRILGIDAKNASAQRALRRVQAEILQGGQQ
ncbi:MAG: type IX secretion system membrane protein PorP/SprF [Elusimicrobia bacterium]|nr:type IX secretion system membrane protein PorP/SprF [Elusimicrobiota bacterium]